MLSMLSLSNKTGICTVKFSMKSQRVKIQHYTGTDCLALQTDPG